MAKLTKKQNILQVLKFTMFSIGAGIIDLASFELMIHVIAFPDNLVWLAQLISLTLSVLFNFTVNRRYTFKSANNVPIAMLKVALFYVVFTPLTSWLTNVLVNDYNAIPDVVKICTMLANFVLEFLYCRFFVYKNSINTNKLANKEQENK